MFLRLSSSALAIGLATAPAAFALTPDEVWTAWKTYYSSSGYTVTEGSRDLAGETLTVKDVALNYDADGTKVVMTVPQIVLQGAGDGSVRTTSSESMPMRIETVDADQKPIVIDLTLSAPGMEVVSSGDGTKRTDKSTAPNLTVTVDKIDLADDPDLTNVGSVTFTDTVSETATDDGKTYTSTGTSAKVAFAADVTQPDGSFKADGTIDAVSADGAITLPEGGISNFADNMAAALKSGMAMNGTVKFGQAQFKFDFSQAAKDDVPASQGSATGSSATTEVTFRMAENGLGYQGATTGVDASITDSQMPAPVAYKLDSGTFDVQFPLAKSDTPAPFKVAYSLGNLTLADSVWDLFDPSKKLPRTPANLDLDVTGLAKVNKDLLDPATLEPAATDPAGTTDPATGTAPSVAPPGEPADAATADAGMPVDPTEITINNFSLDAVGAKVSAEGALKAPDGGTIQTPVGTVNARLEGVNGLIDALTAMGLVPPEQVQGFRMMLAMFAKPGEGTDVLTSELEFKEDGSILANGQQIK